MTTLVFVPNPHLQVGRPFAVPYVPLELLSAMGTAEAAGAETALFDPNYLVESGRLAAEPGVWATAAEMLAELEPDLVLLEAWTESLHNTLQLASHLKRRLPGVPLLLGGAGSSALAVELLGGLPYLDGVVRGELEPALALLAREPRLPLPAAPGLVRRSGTAIVDEPLAWVEDLDALPRPAYASSLGRPGDSLPLEAGRGCTRGCAFCALAGHWVPRYRPRRPADLAREMLELAARYPGSRLDLTQDPSFFLDADRVDELCRALGEGRVSWTCHARPDSLSAASLARMAGAGCAGILFGVESGCPAMQELLGKRIELERVLPTVEAALAQGVQVTATFMVGHPAEGWASLERTARLVMQTRQAGAATQVHLIRAYPGSPLHGQYVATLVPEPMLLACGPEDNASRELIREHPAWFTTSYRLPGLLPREQILAVWLALGALGEPLVALARQGVDAGRLLRQLCLPAVPESRGPAILQVAEQLEALLRDDVPIDRVSFGDLLTYHYHLEQLGEARALEPPETDQPRDDLLAAMAGQAGALVPYLLGSYRAFPVRTSVEKLVAGCLTPSNHEASTVLLAKVCSPGAASFYTRRAYEIRTFELEPLGAELLRRCDGRQDLAGMASAVAAQTARPQSEVLEDLVSAAAVLADAAVLGLRRR